MFKRDDFMMVAEIAEEFKVSRESIRRWIRKKYLNPDAVEVHGGEYYVSKVAVYAWKDALEGKPPVSGRRLPALEGFRGIYKSEAEADSE